MAARWTAWIVWAALAASLVFWGTRLLVRPSPLPAQAQTVATDSGVQADLLRLFAVAAPSDGGAALPRRRTVPWPSASACSAWPPACRTPSAAGP
ncbi:MAG: hypothetical protein IPG57_02975 [Burkholderiales bacterium]|nr:hypothetical protein [Burkholderiales bacterium]